MARGQAGAGGRMRLTLHIGLPKTATSSVQHLLSTGKGGLARRGVCHPGTTPFHHLLARSVASARSDRQRVADETLAGFAEEARAVGAGHVVLSSEHLVSVGRPGVARLRAALARQFPQAGAPRVLCYVREPVSFAASLCQQEVKSGKLRLAAFLADPWPVRLADWLEGYAEVFGAEAMSLRWFDPLALREGDILRDVLAELGLPDFPLPEVAPVLNRSLTAEGVQVADALAAIRPDAARMPGRRRAYKRMLEKIEGRRFILPDDVQARVIAASASDYARIKAMFGLAVPPLRMPASGWPPLSPEEADMRARGIVERVEGLAGG